MGKPGWQGMAGVKLKTVKSIKIWKGDYDIRAHHMVFSFSLSSFNVIFNSDMKKTLVFRMSWVY